MPLVTSVDGTQTFGWGNGEALFPSTPPLITMPPYMELEFPLYLKPKSQAFEDVIAAILKSLRQPSTPLNAAFFSKANVDLLQTAIIARVVDALGVVIDRQSDWELLLIMRRVYLETANNWPDDVGQEVVRLNNLVFTIATESISRNIVTQTTYRLGLAQTMPLLDPAESLVLPPYLTSEPALLRDVNDTYEARRAEFMRTLTPGPSEEWTMAPLTRSPSTSLSRPNSEYGSMLMQFLSTLAPTLAPTLPPTLAPTLAPTAAPRELVQQP